MSFARVLRDPSLDRLWRHLSGRHASLFCRRCRRRGSRQTDADSASGGGGGDGDGDEDGVGHMGTDRVAFPRGSTSMGYMIVFSSVSEGVLVVVVVGRLWRRVTVLVCCCCCAITAHMTPPYAIGAATHPVAAAFVQMSSTCKERCVSRLRQNEAS